MGKGKKATKIQELDDRPALECAGKTLKELIEGRLDEYIDELMDSDTVEGLKKSELATLKGTADGLTQALAIITKPYYPNVDAIKEAAMERYEERNS